jgi:hypothetical protein
MITFEKIGRSRMGYYLVRFCDEKTGISTIEAYVNNPPSSYLEEEKYHVQFPMCNDRKPRLIFELSSIIENRWIPSVEDMLSARELWDLEEERRMQDEVLEELKYGEIDSQRLDEIEIFLIISGK